MRCMAPCVGSQGGESLEKAVVLEKAPVPSFSNVQDLITTGSTQGGSVGDSSSKLTILTTTRQLSRGWHNGHHSLSHFPPYFHCPNTVSLTGILSGTKKLLRIFKVLSNAVVHILEFPEQICSAPLDLLITLHRLRVESHRKLPIIMLAS